MQKMDGKTMNIVAENVGKLKELFPEAFTEGKVDFEALKEVLGTFVDDRDERYSFTWNGKSKARMIAQTPSTGTLRPCKEESVDWDSTQNIFIEGDNLEVLKLLQKSYHKKVKMIYIDPPYNTGKDFVYKDNFKDNIKNYKEITGQVDGEGRNLSNKPETSGRYHTDWLNMMYPRLKLARNLLSDDGVIFMSIDDNEVSNLRKMCDEIFGEENFLSSSMVLSNPRGRQSDTFVATVHDSLVIYCKDISWAKINGMPLTEKQRAEFNLADDDGEAYRLLGLRQRGAASKRSDRPDMYFPIFVCPVTQAISLEENPDWHKVLPRKSDGSDGRWMWGKEKCLNDANLLVARLIERRNEYDIFVKDYLNKAGKERTRKYKSLWDLKTYNNQAGTLEVKAIFKADVMSFPKSKQLLIDICNMGSSKNDIVMDFFAGSATTAHAVMQLNVSNGENRKFVLVQLPEKLDETEKQKKENKEAIKFLSENSLPAVLSEISKERIRRAAAKIKEENPEYEGDLGFKVFKLDSTNIRPWEVEFDLTERTLEDFISNIKIDRKEEDVLYEVLLKYGLDLTLPITEHAIAGQKVFDIGMGALIICLSDAISLEVVEGIAKLKDELNPEIMRVVFKDSGFKDDVVKTNAIQILKKTGIIDVRSL